MTVSIACSLYNNKLGSQHMSVTAACCVQMSSPFRYFVDAIFTQYLILPVSILCWRNLWTIYDNFWFPGLKLTGDILALLVGWAGCVLLLALEVPLTAFAVFLSTKHYLARLAFEDSRIFIAADFLVKNTQLLQSLSKFYFLCILAVICLTLSFYIEDPSNTILNKHIFIRKILLNGLEYGCSKGSNISFK